MSGQVLPREFFERPPRVVARALLGKLLFRRTKNGKLVAGRIVETEAYLGEDDPAAHAYSGKTARNAVLYGPAGHAYVYFTYGMHYCMNVTCEGEGRPGCVLIRALEAVTGFEVMARARRMRLPQGLKSVLERSGIGTTKVMPLPDGALSRSRSKKQIPRSARNDKSLEAGAMIRKLTSGPARLCEALGITRNRDNGKDVTAESSDLMVMDDGSRAGKVKTTPRIGISRAKSAKLRYVIAGNPFVSR